MVLHLGSPAEHLEKLYQLKFDVLFKLIDFVPDRHLTETKAVFGLLGRQHKFRVRGQQHNRVMITHVLLSWRHVVIVHFLDSIHVHKEHVVDFQVPELLLAEALPGLGEDVRPNVLVEQQLKAFAPGVKHAGLFEFEVSDTKQELKELAPNESRLVLDQALSLAFSGDKHQIILGYLEPVVDQLGDFTEDRCLDLLNKRVCAVRAVVQEDVLEVGVVVFTDLQSFLVILRVFNGLIELPTLGISHQTLLERQGSVLFPWCKHRVLLLESTNRHLRL